MHPDDAGARNLASGQLAVVATSVGEILARVSISDEVMVGVVCMPHGWGHGSRDGVGWTHAVSLGGASVNDITDDSRYDPLSGNAAVTAVPVSVRSATMD